MSNIKKSVIALLAAGATFGLTHLAVADEFPISIEDYGYTTASEAPRQLPQYPGS